MIVPDLRIQLQSSNADPQQQQQQQEHNHNPKQHHHHHQPSSLSSPNEKIQQQQQQQEQSVSPSSNQHHYYQHPKYTNQLSTIVASPQQQNNHYYYCRRRVSSFHTILLILYYYSLLLVIALSVPTIEAIKTSKSTIVAPAAPVLIGGDSTISSTSQRQRRQQQQQKREVNSIVQPNKAAIMISSKPEEVVTSTTTTTSASTTTTSTASTSVLSNHPSTTKRRRTGILDSTVQSITKTKKSTAKVKEESTTANNKTFVRDPIYMYSSLIAGIGSGAISGIVCAPLDLIKTRMQIWGSIQQQSAAAAAATTTAGGGGGGAATNQFIKTAVNSGGVVGIRSVVRMLQDIIHTEGIVGCFRGLGATLITVPAFWGVYFPLYDDFKRYWVHHYPNTEPALVHMGSAVAAGAISDVICNPMFVVRTRLQTEAVHNMIRSIQLKQQQAAAGVVVGAANVGHVSSMWQTIQVLYKEGGITTFWRGMTANLLGLSHVAIQFPAYEYLKRQLLIRQQQHKKLGDSNDEQQQQQQQHNTAFDLLLASAASKMIASIVTYPHEVIRSRMMDARTTAAAAGAVRLGFVATCTKIYTNEGMIGFYSGLPVSLIRVIPNTCLTFVTYELFLRYSRQYLSSSPKEQ